MACLESKTRSNVQLEMLRWTSVTWPTKSPFWTARHVVQNKPLLITILRQASKEANPKVYRNEGIPIKVVQVANREDGRLGPPIALQELLQATDLKKNFVQLVSSEPPVVRISSYYEVAQAKKAAKVKQKLHKVEQKEVQLTWGISDSDLDHKMKKAKEELLKGNRVDVAFGPKSRKIFVPLETKQSILQNVTAILSEVGKEYKPAQSRGQFAVLSFEGRKSKDTVQD